MQFQITIKDNGTQLEQTQFEQFGDVMNYLTEKIAAWNNFTPEHQFDIELAKVTSNIPTLGVSVADELDVAALFGGQP